MPASLELKRAFQTSARGRGTRSHLVDINALPPSALCTTAQVAAVSGFAEITLKVWRRTGGKGPKVVKVEGRPRYRVSDVWAWLSSVEMVD